MLEVPSFNGGLHTAVASKPFPIPTSPVDSVLIAVVDPILVVVVYQDHAASSV